MSDTGETVFSPQHGWCWLLCPIDRGSDRQPYNCNTDVCKSCAKQSERKARRVTGPSLGVASGTRCKIYYVAAWHGT